MTDYNSPDSVPSLDGEESNGNIRRNLNQEFEEVIVREEGRGRRGRGRPRGRTPGRRGRGERGAVRGAEFRREALQQEAGDEWRGRGRARKRG